MYNIFTLPLRLRKEDIRVLISDFLIEFNRKHNCNKTIDIKANEILEDYLWPGNIAQLKNFVFRILKLSENDTITDIIIKNELNNEFKYIEKNFLESWKANFNDLISKNIRGYLNHSNKINAGIYYKLLREFERPLIIEILKYTNSNQLLSSELLGINRNTLRKKMADYEIEIIKKSN